MLRFVQAVPVALNSGILNAPSAAVSKVCVSSTRIPPLALGCAVGWAFCFADDEEEADADADGNEARACWTGDETKESVMQRCCKPLGFCRGSCYANAACRRPNWKTAPRTLDTDIDICLICLPQLMQMLLLLPPHGRFHSSSQLRLQPA